MSDCDKALGFWKIGINYLHLVKVVSNETYKQGNQIVVACNTPIDDDSLIEKHNNETKWSDFRLVIPLLFNFYHGLELLLKGFICTKNIKIKSTHKLSQLLSSFKTNFQDSALTPYFEKYIEQDKLPTILLDFCSKSCISIDNYYQALKYPERQSGSCFEHSTLKYHGQSGTQFFKDLRDDIEKIQSESVNLGRKIYPNCPNV